MNYIFSIKIVANNCSYSLNRCSRIGRIFGSVTKCSNKHGKYNYNFKKIDTDPFLPSDGHTPGPG